MVAPGTYREVLNIDKPDIQLRSAIRREQDGVVFDRDAAASGGTLHTATVNVSGDISSPNITFQNDFKITRDPNITGSQAVALKVTGDRAIFRNVRLLGFRHSLRGSKGCTGTGEARVCKPARQYFARVTSRPLRLHLRGWRDGLRSLRDSQKAVSRSADRWVHTAQSKVYPQQDSGYVIYKSRLTANPA